MEKKKYLERTNYQQQKSNTDIKTTVIYKLYNTLTHTYTNDRQ